MNEEIDDIDAMFPLPDEEIVSFCINHTNRPVHWSRLLCDDCKDSGNYCSGCGNRDKGNLSCETTTFSQEPEYFCTNCRDLINTGLIQ